jgi:hypothetical protein
MDVYLNDHLAGAMFGSELARQIESQAQGTPLAARIGELATQIEDDQQALRELMERLDVTKNPVKQAATWVGEKFSRVKLSGVASGGPGLGLFMALETLSLGVEGKASLWRMLRQLQDRYPALEASRLDELIGRAEAQREVLETERGDAGRRVFVGADQPR